MFKRMPFVVSLLIFGYAFLYIPIITVIVYSFNENRLVTVWSGFSTRWYGELLNNSQILGAAWLSVKIAASNATLAVILATLAAFALVRFQRFRGRQLMEVMVSAPLVMPEVLIGLSLLLLFVGMEQLFGWPENRGQLTITLAHTTFSMAYVTVLIRSRLVNLDPSLEEAAMDLGAKPWRVFVWITMPLIAPALLAGWLLAFTLSMDDLVVASFVSGPGASTLPMVVYSSVRLGVSPQINALATIIVLIVSVFVAIVGFLTYRHQQRLQK